MLLWKQGRKNSILCSLWQNFWHMLCFISQKWRYKHKNHTAIQYYWALYQWDSKTNFMKNFQNILWNLQPKTCYINYINCTQCAIFTFWLKLSSMYQTGFSKKLTLLALYKVCMLSKCIQPFNKISRPSLLCTLHKRNATTKHILILIPSENNYS